jgi:3-hydroxyisobutyrate dehydrogenase
MRFAVIGLGEVGRCFAQALHQAGYPLGLCEARPSPAAEALARSLGQPIHPVAGDWLKEADWVLSCVTGTVALAVARQMAPHMRQGAAIADLTTASPGLKREAAAFTKTLAVRYLDVAIMGGILARRERTPLLVAGEGADEFRLALEKIGSPVSTIDKGAAGDAMSLKILRSIFTKGMEALSVELLMSAETQGVREKLYTQLADIDQTPLRDFIDMLVCTHVVHAGRRGHEVGDAAAEMASQGMPSTVLPGVQARFRQTAAALEIHPHALPEPRIDQALGWLLAHTR